MAAKNPWEMDALQFANTYYKRDPEEEARRKREEEAKKAAEDIAKSSKKARLANVVTQMQPYELQRGKMPWEQGAYKKREEQAVAAQDWTDVSSQLRAKGVERSLADTAAADAMPSQYPSRAELEARSETFTEEDVAYAEANLTRTPIAQAALETGRGLAKTAKSVAAGASWLTSKVPGMDSVSKALSGKTATQRTADLVEKGSYERLGEAGYTTPHETVGQLGGEAIVGVIGGKALSGTMRAASGARWSGEKLVQSVAEGMAQEAIDTSLRTAAGVSGYEWKDLPTNVALAGAFDVGVRGALKGASKLSSSRSSAIESAIGESDELRKLSEKIMADGEAARKAGDYELTKRIEEQANRLIAKAERSGPEDWAYVETNKNAYDPKLAPDDAAPISERASYYDSLGKDAKKEYRKTLSNKDFEAIQEHNANLALEYHAREGGLTHGEGRMADDADVAWAKAQVMDLVGAKLKRIDFDTRTGDKLYLFEGMEKHVPARDMKAYKIDVDEDGVPVGSYFSSKAPSWHTSVYVNNLAREAGANPNLVERGAIPVINDLLNVTNDGMVRSAKKAGKLDQLAETEFTTARGAGKFSDAQKEVVDYVKQSLGEGRVITRNDVIEKTVEATRKHGVQWSPKSVAQTWKDMPEDAMELLQGRFGDRATQIRKNLDDAKAKVDFRKANATRKLIEEGQYDPQKAVSDWAPQLKEAGIVPLFRGGDMKDEAVAMFRALEDSRVPVKSHKEKWRLEQAAKDTALYSPADAARRKEIVAEGKKLMDDIEVRHKAAIAESEAKLKLLESSPLLKPLTEAQLAKQGKKATAKEVNGSVAKERLQQNLKRRQEADSLRAVIKRQKEKFAEERRFALMEWRKKLEINGAFSSPSQKAKGIYESNMTINLGKLKELLPKSDFSDLVRYAKSRTPSTIDKVQESMESVIAKGVKRAQTVWLARAEDALKEMKGGAYAMKDAAAAQSLTDQLISYRRTGDIDGMKAKVEEIEDFLRGAREEARGLKQDVIQGIDDDAIDSASKVEKKVIDRGNLSKFTSRIVGQGSVANKLSRVKSFFKDVGGKVLDMSGTLDDALRSALPDSGYKYVKDVDEEYVKYANKVNKLESLYSRSAKGIDDYGKTEVGIAAQLEANPHLMEDIVDSPHIVYDRKTGRLLQDFNARQKWLKDSRYDAVITPDMVKEAVKRVEMSKKEGTLKHLILDIANDPDVYRKASDNLFAISGERLGRVEGKYLPIMRMGSAKSQAELLEQNMENMTLMKDGMYDPAAIRKQFTKGRKEDASGAVNVSPDAIMTQYLETNVRYAMTGRSVYRLARFKDAFSRGVKKAPLSGADLATPPGDRYVGELLQSKLERATSGTSETKKDRNLPSSIINAVDSFMTLKSLGLNATSDLIQTVQPLSVAGVKGVNIGSVYSNAAKSLDLDAFDHIYDASPAIRARVAAGETVLHSRIDSGIGLAGKLLRGKEDVSNVLMKGITFTDARMSAGIWADQYSKAMKKSGKEWKMGDRVDMESPESIAAIAKADAWVRRAMGTGEKAFRARMFDSPLTRAVFFLGKSATTNMSTVLREMVQSGSLSRKAAIALGFVGMTAAISALRTTLDIAREEAGMTSKFTNDKLAKMREAFEAGYMERIKWALKSMASELAMPGVIPSEFGGREMGIAAVAKDFGRGVGKAYDIVEGGVGSPLQRMVEGITAVFQATLAPGEVNKLANLVTVPAKERADLGKSMKDKGLDVSGLSPEVADAEIKRKAADAAESKKDKNSFSKFLKSRVDAGEWYSDDADPFKELAEYAQMEADRRGKDITTKEYEQMKKKFVAYAKSYGEPDAVVANLKPESAVDYLVNKYGNGKFTQEASDKAQELYDMGLITDDDAEKMLSYLDELQAK